MPVTINKTLTARLDSKSTIKAIDHFWFSLQNMMCFKIIPFLSLIFLGFIPNSPAQTYDGRSDSCDILHEELYLEVLDFTNKTITGRAFIRLTPKVNNLGAVRFDLRNLTVDSVTFNGQPIAFIQNGESVLCSFSQLLNIGDTATLMIRYGGSPTTGTGSFGGFYWSGSFAFNIGVSLNDIPHPFGRAWMPCFDNFVERFTLTCHVRVATSQTAVCGGVLQGVTNHGDGTHTFTWALQQPVPSYLMSVAVGPYAFVQGNLFTASGQQVPYLLAARAQDTTQMKNSFVNLPHALLTFTQLFGPYVWGRVGYVLVPFTSGAMEHACNIAFPQLMANGSTTYETTMAHELAHCWWGNNATCRTPADMWINEGLATYCEALFLESLTGYQSYLDHLRNNHKNVLEKAHIEDSTYHPLSPMPERFTYGYHTYFKGSTALHNLRTYLGDSAFFGGLKAIQNQYHFKDVDAEGFRTALEGATGQPLSHFFNDWIYQPGFAAFELDSVTYTPLGGSYKALVSVTQKLRAANHFFQQVPLRITFVKNAQETYTVTLLHSGEHQLHTVSHLPFLPEAAVLNAGSELLYAVTGTSRVVKSTGSTQLSYSRLRLIVNTVADSVWWHGAMHWVKPDTLQNWQNGLVLIPSRFWRVDWAPADKLSADLQFQYDGGNNYLSFEKGFIPSEDSLVVLYRPDDRVPWQVWSQVTHQKGNAHDKMGSFTVHQAAPGEYCFGLRNGYTGIEGTEQPLLKVWPNPAGPLVHVLLPPELVGREALLRVCDSTGKTVHKRREKWPPVASISTLELPPGTYHMYFSSGRHTARGTFVKP